MEKKINILVITTDIRGGVGFFRCIQPHEQLKRQYPDKFNITIETQPDFGNIEKYGMYDIVCFHKGIYTFEEGLNNLLTYCREHGIITIMDIDDYWVLGTHHPNQGIGGNSKPAAQKVTALFKQVDYVTTTTDIFANSIKPFNKNVKVFPNAINPTDSRFTVNRQPSEKLRFGMIMGSTHLFDLNTMSGFMGKLPADIRGKMEFVLCGFDTRGVVRMYNKDTGKEEQRQMRPEETVWYQYEKIVTEDYKYISPMYKSFLLRFMPQVQYPYADAEGYKRRWTLPIDKYFQHYNDIDVLLAPLESNDFNRHKSQLKAIECAFSHTAFIGSDFGPYQIDLRSMLKKGGDVDMTANAILIDNNKAHKDWSKAIEKLVKNPDMVTALQENLYNDYKDKYDLRNITDDRAAFYTEIINNKNITRQ